MSVTSDTKNSKTPQVSKRDQRKAESRERLMTAARRLFVERGYHDTRPQDISREAGVGHGTFYLYFSDKRACFQAFTEETREDIDTLVQSEIAKCDNGAERIYTALKTVMEYSERNPGLLRAAWAGEQLMSSESGSDLDSLLARRAEGWAIGVRESQNSGVAWQDYDADVIGQVILVITSMVTISFGGTAEDKHRYLQNLTKFVVRALLVPNPDGRARTIDGPDENGKVRIVVSEN